MKERKNLVDGASADRKVKVRVEGESAISFFRLGRIEDCPILRVSLLNCANDQIDSIGLLGVDENDHAAAAELQHFAKRRHALAPVLTEVAVVANAIVTNFGKSEVTHLTLLPRGPINRRIVNRDQHPIGRGACVDFDEVDLQLNRCAEGGK